MLDFREDTVWTNAFYLLPAVPAAKLGGPEFLIVCVASIQLAWSSAGYHTTYQREDQREDVSGMLTYLVALFAVIVSSWSSFLLLLPIAAHPIHVRYAWDLNVYIVVPAYIVISLVALALQVGLLLAAPAAVCALLGGAVKLAQAGRDSPMHSLWHVAGGLSAALALGALARIFGFFVW